jgi:hypothetical protein
MCHYLCGGTCCCCRSEPTDSCQSDVHTIHSCEWHSPNGIAATQSGIFLTQPFTDGLQPRGIYSITTTGAVASAGSISTAAGVSAENGLAIAPGIGSGFTAGDRFASGVSTTNSANNAVYKNGSATPFIDAISASLSKHQTALAFDEVGTFSGALIVTGRRGSIPSGL